MGNNGSFMEKVYVYLPVLMCHSRMDYKDAVTVRNIRLAYGLEQVSASGGPETGWHARTFAHHDYCSRDALDGDAPSKLADELVQKRAAFTTF